MSIHTLLLSVVLLTGPNAGPDDKCPEACTLTAQPVNGSIDIDGRLDEADWQTAPIATDFVQYEPNEGAAPSQRTEVRILYGGSAVYIGAVLYDEEPGKIMKTLGRRDAYNQADWFIASIDSYFDRKTAYNFAVNAAGVQADGILSGRSFGPGGGGSGFGFDTSWDAVWDASVRVTAQGWTVEMRIPYSMLRFPEADVLQWGINFRRIIPRFSETDDWVLVPRAERRGGTVARYGILGGLKNIQPRRNLQVTPYTVSRMLTEEGDPGQLRREGDVDFGGDLKVGLSSNVTLDATINPDFGQVDSDPAELNLTAFETRFRERRPFFTEGVQIFNYSLDRGGSLLYTRRIGGRAPIIGASKLSGRTSKGLSFGVMGAATGDHFDPSRYYGVARLKQQFGQLSSIGGILTAYQQNDERRSLVGGLDWDLRLKNNTYKFDGQASFTHRAVPGSDLTPEQGFSFISGFDKIQGTTNFFSGVTVISDDFNPNDVGQLRRNNFNLSGGFSHQINGGNAFGPFRRASMWLFVNQDFSYRNGLDLGLGTFLSTTWLTRGFQEISIRFQSDNLFGGYDIYETRGLGPRTQPRELGIRASYETDSRRAWQAEPNVNLKFFGDGGHNYDVGLRTKWNVNSRLNLSASVGYGGDAGVTAWASNEAFGELDGGWGIGEEKGAPDSDTVFQPFDDGGQLDALFATTTPYDDQGHFYLPVFGERDTRSVDLTLRGDLTFSPTLSIQLYGQVFTARGQYQNFSLLEDRDTLTPLDAYPKRHDFAFTSFQTNTVLRWEYRPGSTLFFVWSQSRQGKASIDPFDIDGRSSFDQRSPDQLLDAFTPYPTNVFLIKLSYKFLR